MPEFGDQPVYDFIIDGNPAVYVSPFDNISFVNGLDTYPLMQSRKVAAWRMLRGVDLELHGNFYIRGNNKLVIDHLVFTVGPRYEGKRVKIRTKMKRKVKRWVRRKVCG